MNILISKTFNEKSEEYSIPDSQMWATENVYDRGRQNLTNIPTAVQQQSEQHIFYDSEQSLKIIQADDLELVQNVTLGFTKTAKVFFGRLKSYQNDEEYFEDVAIKVFTPKSISQQELIKTISPWSKIKHNNVVEIKGLYMKSNDLPYVVMECGKGGLLKDFLRKIDFKLPLRIVLNWALQITNGIIEIHAKNVIHRDIASGNIVMTNNGEAIKDMETSILKLIDLNDKKTSGTPLNMSPESFDEIVTKESEVFSFGCFLWELLTQHKEKPFESYDYYLDQMTPFNFAKMVGIDKRTLKIPEDCEPKLAELMKKCWKFDPQERPSFTEIKNTLNELMINGIFDQSENDDVQEEYNESDYDEEDEDEEFYYSSNELATTSYSENEQSDLEESKSGEDGFEFDVLKHHIPNLF